MRIKAKVAALCGEINKKFFTQFGFDMKDMNFSKLQDYMHEPKDSSSLAVTRILFGLAMLFDIPDERGGVNMIGRWGDPTTCHFPLLLFIQPISMPYMALVYAALWFGAVGIMLGYKYSISAPLFSISYWYLFVIEKSFWNNHSYLFGLVALLLTCTDANCYWSIDARRDPSKLKTTVPYWNYFILKYQFFILYFMAGMKKGTAEWLTGYSVQNLSEHWVFEPFKLFLTVPQTDYFVVHWFVFVFDLTVAIWMMYLKTRHVAMFFGAMFHLMNSRLFRIGMFPWVCLATMPLFYPFDWPKVLISNFKSYFTKVKAGICRNINKIINCKVSDCKLPAKKEVKEKYKKNRGDKCPSDDKKNERLQQIDENVEDDVSKDKTEDIKETKAITTTVIGDNTNSRNEFNNKKKTLTMYLIIFHLVTQLFLPYSHFITKGYNNWTNGLYGYSWDMMVHTWDTHTVIVKIVDNDKHSEHYVDPYIYTPNDRWTRHGDMVYQYARCLKDKLIKETWGQPDRISENISIYIDVWCSMNGRFTQRLFDSKADLLKVDWSPFKSVSYLMPLLDDALTWRNELDERRQHVHSWNSYSDVVFLADFPGYEQEKYISPDLKNVTLTILEGDVVYEPQVTMFRDGHSYKLTTGETIDVDIGTFHKVLNIGETPAYYMYTFYNGTEVNALVDSVIRPKLPIVTELVSRFTKMFVFVNLLLKNIAQIVFSLFSKCS